LGWREGPTDEYQWLNYQESLLRAQNFGSGLVALGLRPGPETLVGIYCQNCPEWVLSEYGLYSFSMVIVPLYDTLGPDACRYIINQSKNSCFFYSSLLVLFADIFCFVDSRNVAGYLRQ
jgi:long-chain acyl-CoA synthetase